MIEQKAKIKYLSRRGMLELDLILNSFLTKYLNHLDLKQLEQLELILNYDDPELYAILIENLTPKPEAANIVKLIHSSNCF